MQTITRPVWVGATLAAAMVATSVLGVAVTPAAAQTPFRVYKPENGSRVRETVRIILLRSALKDAKYLSLSIDDKFRAALEIPAPRTDGTPVKSDMVVADKNAVAILWDTKGTSRRTADAAELDKDKPQVIAPPVEDGEHAVEIIAHDSAGKQIGAQTLRLIVSNRVGIAMPAGGISLNYHFSRGDEAKYSQVTSVRYVGENQQPARGTISGGQGYASPGFGTYGGGGYGYNPGGGGGGDLDGGAPAARRGGPPGGFGGRRGGGGGFSGSGGPPPGVSGGGPGGFRGGSGFSGGQGFGGPPAGFGGSGYGGPGGGGFPGGAGYTAQPTGPFTLPVQDVHADYERTIEDVAGPDTFFVRDKVTDGTIIAGNGAAALLKAVYDFKSRYRTVRDTGYVVDNGIASAARPGAYVALLIPNLNGGRRRIGDTWNSQTPVLLEWATMDKPPYVNAKNRLEALEWQDGYQTARVLQTYDGKADIPIFGGAGVMRQAHVKMDRVIWFAFNAGKVVRTETTIEVEGNAPSDVLSSMVPGANVNAGGVGGIAGGGGASGGFMGGYGPPPGLTGSSVSGAPAGVGGAGEGFGALTQQQAAPLVPAKFRSVTTVSLVKPATAASSTKKVTVKVTPHKKK